MNTRLACRWISVLVAAANFGAALYMDSWTYAFVAMLCFMLVYWMGHAEGTLQAEEDEDLLLEESTWTT